MRCVPLCLGLAGGVCFVKSRFGKSRSVMVGQAGSGTLRFGTLCSVGVRFVLAGVANYGAFSNGQLG